MVRLSLATALAACVHAMPVAAGDRTPTEARNVATALRLFEEGWGARPGWELVWREAMSPEVRSFFHAYPPNVGIEDVITFNRDLFAGFPTLEVTVEDVVAEDDTVVVRSRLRGTHDGPFLGIPASGRLVEVPDVTVFRLSNGEIVESRYFTDLVAVMTAIGAMPPPAD